jgi:hypothetical protein
VEVQILSPAQWFFDPLNISEWGDCNHFGKCRSGALVEMNVLARELLIRGGVG